MASVKKPPVEVPPAKAPQPVSLVPGAMWGYCPRCSAPVVFREKPVDGKWGKDRCQTGHEFRSLDAMPRPLVAPPPPSKAKPLKRRGR